MEMSPGGARFLGLGFNTKTEAGWKTSVLIEAVLRE